MLQPKIDEIRSIFLTDEFIYLNVDDDFKAKDVVLIVESIESEFESCKIRKSKRYSFVSDKSPELVFEKDEEKEVFGPVDVSLNRLTDWAVPGSKTVQIELDQRDTAYEMQFPNQIIAKDAAGTLQFHARLASHRAGAELLVDFTDLDTEIVTRHVIAFDTNYQGGKLAEDYQSVTITAPAGVVNLSAKLAISYTGCIERTSPFPPFLFVLDPTISEDNPGDDLSEILFGDVSEEGTWLKAKPKKNLSDLTYALLRVGKKTSTIFTKPVEIANSYFDSAFYTRQNEDIDLSGMDAFTHYLLEGWKSRRKPNPDFSVREYLLRHPDIEALGIEPLIHYSNVGRKEHRSLGTFEEKLHEIWNFSGQAIPNADQNTIFQRAQDMMVPMSLISSKKVAVFVVPEHNAMSGGIYSIFSIADHLRRTRHQHGFDVLVMTRPNKSGTTYVRNSSFKNSETVYRLEQLRLFSEVSELQIHIPEYATNEFVRSLSPNMVKYLMRRDSVHINILNQNTRLMPKPELFKDLRRICDTLGQSVSHHAFFGKEFADYYDLPSLLLPAFTDLTPYPKSTFSEKSNIIIYSDDEAPYKRAVLNELEKLSEYRLVKIRDMTFDTYMELATQCKFSVSFGEGLDGYVAQPIYQGGIGFALYNEEFFPDPSFKKFENFFETEQAMISGIVPSIRRLEKNQKRYETLNRSLQDKWDELYSYDDYKMRIAKLIRREYEVLPEKPA